MFDNLYYVSRVVVSCGRNSSERIKTRLGSFRLETAVLWQVIFTSKLRFDVRPVYLVLFPIPG